MARSADKKRFLRNLPDEIRVKYRPTGGYWIPSKVKLGLEKLYAAGGAINGCKDFRDYVTKAALAGLRNAQSEGGDIMQISAEFGYSCDAAIYIDYAVIDYDEMRKFCNLVNGIYIRTVQDAISYCVILAYFANINTVRCDPKRVVPAIYS